jgi:hypothetical protein
VGAGAVRLGVADGQGLVVGVGDRQLLEAELQRANQWVNDPGNAAPLRARVVSRPELAEPIAADRELTDQLVQARVFNVRPAQGPQLGNRALGYRLPVLVHLAYPGVEKNGPHAIRSDWQIQTPTTEVNALIFALDGTQFSTRAGLPNLSTFEHGSGGFFFVDVVDLDADGDVTGATFYNGNARPAGESGFSQTLGPRLRTAAVNWSDVPGSTCTYGPDFVFIDCTDSVFDATVTWTGEGPIRRGALNSIFILPDFGVVSVAASQSQSRDATASGVLAGITLPADANAGPPLIGRTSEANIDTCIGPTCF